MKRFLTVLIIFIALPVFASIDNNGLEKWDEAGVKTPFTEESNPRTLYEEISAIQSQTNDGQFDSNGGVKVPFTMESSSHSLYEDVSAIQSQPYSNEINIMGFLWLILIIGVVIAVLNWIVPNVEDIGTTKEERQARKRKIETKEELLLVQNLINTFQAAKDAEIAECVYALMTYRDDRYNTSQIQAFLYPNEYEPLIKNYILDDLEKSLHQLKLFKHKNIILPIIWWHTLNSYLVDENRQIIQELWTQLSRGFELSRSKYLETSSKKFNFDNSDFFKVPDAMLNN